MYRQIPYFLAQYHILFYYFKKFNLESSGIFKNYFKNIKYCVKKDGIANNLEIT